MTLDLPGKWSGSTRNGRTHVVPLNDLKEHINEGCPCGPRVERIDGDPPLLRSTRIVRGSPHEAGELILVAAWVRVHCFHIGDRIAPVITTRCKFVVQEVTRQQWNCADAGQPKKWAERIKLSAICSGDDPESVSFSKATPQGEMTFTVSNPAVIGQFEPGDEVYLDLIPCPKK
jgi:hypothetical protein